MATQKELAGELAGVLEQQKKTSGEIATVQASVNDLKLKILALEDAARNGAAIPELVDMVAAVKAQAQVVDDQIPDVVAETPAAGV